MRTPTAVMSLVVLSLLITGQLSVADDKPTVEKALVNLQVGDAAPAFKGTDDRGQAWDSAEHFGKNYTVIYFYPADFTGGCIKQAETFRDTMNQLTEQGITVIGVSGDSVNNHQLFKKAWTLNHTLLADEEGEIAKVFGVPVSKGGKVVAHGSDRKRLLNDQGETIFIERKATFARWTFLVGPNGQVIYKNTKVMPADDAKQVLEFIQQDKASTEISTRGGKLEFEEQQSNRWVISAQLPGCRFKDEDTVLLASLSRVRAVVLGGNVKDSGLVFVTGLRHLESLTIDSPHLKGSGMAHLTGLPKLRSLNVEGTDVNDDALLAIKDCQQLKEVNLAMTLITDRGLEHLKNMPHLETLNVEATDVTDDGIADFQKALPKVTVIR